MNSALWLQIILLASVRIVFNTMYRMVYPFLGEFSQGMGVGLPEMSRAFTLRSIAGGFAPLLAFISDSRGRKVGMLLGLSLITLGASLLVIWPSYGVFVLSLVICTSGYQIFGPSMQAYLGDQVPYRQRGLALAVTELGWSLSFIIVVPLAGLLIKRYGWSSPYPVLALLSLVGTLALARLLPGRTGASTPGRGIRHNIKAVLSSPAAWAGLAMSACMTAGNEIVTLVFGLWMEQDFGLQITALGLVAVAIGLAELCAELLVGTWVDRLGKVRATALGLGLNALAAGSFLFVGHSSIGAVVVLLLFFLTFEFSLVSSLPMMTELIPAARASMMAVNNAMFALGRALGAALGGGLYALDISPLPSIAPNVLAAVMFNLLGLAALALLHRWWTGSPGKG